MQWKDPELKVRRLTKSDLGGVRRKEQIFLVLVQREMERRRSPLVSIARASAGRVCVAERNGDWHEDAADGNCNWFQKEDQQDNGSAAPESVGLVELFATRKSLLRS